MFLMQLLYYFMIILSVLVLTSKNPVKIIFFIVMQNINFMIMSTFLKIDYWGVIFMTLVYLGGVMIIFLYVNSCSNNMYFENNQWVYPTSIIIFVLIVLMKKMYLNLEKKMDFSTLTNNFMQYKEIFSLVFMILVTLFIFNINKILKKSKTPLNKML